MTELWVKLLVLAIFLLAHGIASWRGLYHKTPNVDVLTHFLGGIALSAFIKDWAVAIALILGWEFLEMILVSRRWIAFRESPLNKVRDVLTGLLGYLIGVEIL